MTKILNEDVTKQVKEAFKEMQEPVEVIFFGKKDDCMYCEDTRQLLEEITALSDQLTLQRFDLEDDAAIAENYNVDKAPTTVIAGMDEDGPVDYGIRIAGIPSGYAFSSLIQDLLMVSGRDSGLQDNTRQFLAELTEPVHLQIFSTPT
jgi:alkyl hydroperoxide reductase subunit AhpF